MIRRTDPAIQSAASRLRGNVQSLMASYDDMAATAVQEEAEVVAVRRGVKAGACVLLAVIAVLSVVALFL